MSTVLALAAERRWQEADSLFLSIYSGWQEDPRFPGISATLGIARGDLEGAEQWLRAAIESLPSYFEDPLIRRLWSGDVDQSLVRKLKSAYPADWPDYVETALTAEHKFYVLLWQKRHDEARLYARDMVELLRKMKLPAGTWLEREGDALFYRGDYMGALQSYQASLEERRKPDPIFLKLSDVHFKLGDLDRERYYREKIYGRLDAQ
jgi:tetratricopeptide (TPR) repeat protein